MPDLIVKIRTKDEAQAKMIVSELSFEHQVISAKLGTKEEIFGKTKFPVNFLNQSKKLRRDIRKERGIE